MKCINNLRQSYTNQLIVQIKKNIFMHILKTPMQRKIHMWSQQIVQSKDQSILSMDKKWKT